VNGDLNRFSKGELVPGADKVIELSVDGVDVPDDCSRCWGNCCCSVSSNKPALFLGLAFPGIIPCQIACGVCSLKEMFITCLKHKVIQR